MIEIVGTRDLITASKKVVSIEIGKPEKRKEDEFACPFQVNGLGDSRLQYAYGMDAIQALVMALDGIRVTLEKNGESVTWLGGDEGEHGIPRFVPQFFGAGFSKHIELIIDKEIALFAERAQEKAKKDFK